MNYINPCKLVDVRISGRNLEFKFVSAMNTLGELYTNTLTIECPQIVKKLEEHPIMSQIIGEVRAKNINLDQELRKVKRERDVLMDCLELSNGIILDQKKKISATNYNTNRFT